MDPRAPLLKAIGGEAGCRRLSAEFYGRIGKDPILRPFFPGKSLRCAIEEFSAFLIQFLGGDEEQTQFRWWLSLRESHARFQIGPAERRAWLKHMGATLDAADWVIGGWNGAAARLGLSRTTLISRMQRLGIAGQRPATKSTSAVPLFKNESVREQYPEAEAV